jgi:hypothetical protein
LLLFFGGCGAAFLVFWALKTYWKIKDFFGDVKDPERRIWWGIYGVFGLSKEITA